MKRTARTYRSTTERQLELLGVAARLIAEKGLAAATIPDIAAAAGLSVGAVYRHFKSKSTLVAALVETDAARLREAIGKAASDAADPIAALHAWADVQLADLADPVELGLRAEIIALATHDAAIRPSVVRHAEELEKRLRLLIVPAAETGSLADADPHAAVELIASLMDGILVRGAVVGRISPDAAKLVRAALAAVTGRKQAR